MPMLSKAQRGAMHAAAEGKSTIGIPKSVGKKFVAHDTGGSLPDYARPKANRRDYAKGGPIEEEEENENPLAGIRGYGTMKKLVHDYPGWPTMGPLSPSGGGN